MEKKQAPSPLLRVDVDNDVEVALQIAKRETQTATGNNAERVICLRVNGKSAIFNKAQAKRFTGQLNRVCAMLNNNLKNNKL